MNRFNSLEFNRKFEERAETGAVQRDEKFFFAKAEEDFSRADFEPALRAYSKVLEFNPQNVAAWTGQVRALIEMGEFPEAKLWADKGLERFSSHPELLAAKAVALARIGDFKAAIAFSDASVEERGETPYIWLARADVLLARQEKRASFCFDKAFALAPGEWLVYWLAARIQHFYRKFAAALKNAQEALLLNPGGIAPWLQAGQCQLALGLDELALHSFAQVRELDPANEEASCALVRITNGSLLSRIRRTWRRILSLS